MTVIVGLCLLAACGAADKTPPGTTPPGTTPPATTPSVTTPSSPTPDPMPNATWSDPKAWPSGKVPVAGEAVVIPAGKVMMLDVSPPALKSVYISGTLKFAQKDLELTAGYIMVHDGSLQIGSAQIPFTEQATITLTGAETGADNLGMGEKFIGAMGTGTLDLHGAGVTSWTRLTQTAAVGANTLQLEDASGWKVGDAVAIASTDYDTRQAEEFTITKLEGNTATLGSALKFMHYGQAQGFAGKTLESRAEVALLRRNIVVQGETTSSAAGFGGHLMVMDSAKARIANVEFMRMGQLKKFKRYPIHFHMQGDNGEGSYVKNTVLHHNFNRCITVHGTGKLLLEANVGFDTVGHCYFLEDGSEAGNTLKSNLGFMTRCTLVKDQYGGQKGCYQLSAADVLLPTDTEPATYWITNPANTMIGNVAAGSDTFGFWFALPERPTGPSATDARFKDWRLRRTPLTAFKGNIAHSNGNTGLNVDGGPNATTLKSETTGYAARANPLDEKSAIVSVIFEDFTAYRNRNRGVWLRGSLHTVKGAVLADNAIGATFASNDTQLEDSVVIGESANKGTPGQYEKKGLDGRSLPQAYNDDVAKFPIRGFEFYDGKVGASRVTFVNFQTNALRPASALSYLRFTDFNVDPRNSGDQLSFENANRVYLAFEKAEPTAPTSDGMDGYRSAVFKDTDGSVTGSSGRSVVVNNPFLLNGNCTAKPEWGDANICDNPYGTFNFQNEDGNLSEINPVAIQRLEGANPQHKMWGTPNGQSFKDNFETRLISGKSYALTLAGAAPKRSRLQFRNRVSGDSILVSMPWSGAAPFVYRDYNVYKQVDSKGTVTYDSVLKPFADAAALGAEKTSGYYISAGTMFMKLIVPVDANNSKRDWTVLDICVADNCGQPSAVR